VSRGRGARGQGGLWRGPEGSCCGVSIFVFGWFVVCGGGVGVCGRGRSGDDVECGSVGGGLGVEGERVEVVVGIEVGVEVGVEMEVVDVVVSVGAGSCVSLVLVVFVAVVVVVVGGPSMGAGDIGGAEVRVVALSGAGVATRGVCGAVVVAAALRVEFIAGGAVVTTGIFCRPCCRVCACCCQCLRVCTAAFCICKCCSFCFCCARCLRVFAAVRCICKCCWCCCCVCCR
jgi:hypothetical protein